MKKIFIAVAVVAAMGLGFTSCDPDKEKCIEVTITYKDAATGTTATSVEYVWQSENQIDAVLDSVRRTYSNVISTASNTLPGIGKATCLAMNPPK